MIIFTLLVLFSYFRIFRCSSFYTTRETFHQLSDLRKITIDPGSGDIFVGGTNVVLKLNSKFEHVAEFALGPRISSKYCRPYEIKTCPNATKQNNVVSILEFLPALNQTLLCGTLEYGNCSLLTESELRPLAHEENQNYLGSDHGSIFVPFKKDHSSVYYIGTSWDGRQQLMPEEFSFKSLYQMKFSHKTARSKKGLCEQTRERSGLRFIYGFQDEDYVYSLYLMVRIDDGRNYYETKISKVCKGDKYFGSFQELILSCEGYNIATAAYYSNEKDLFVAFGTGNQSLTAQPSSIVCKYSANEIQKRFDLSFVQCYTDLNKRGYSPPRWSSCGTMSVCKDTSHISVKSVCSSDSLYSIQGLESTDPWLKGHTVIYKDPKRILTSVLAQTPIGGEHPIVWVGTTDGFLIKVGIKKTKSVVYSEYDLSGSRKIRIEPDVEVDSGGQNAFFLHGNKVSKFPLNSCRIYSTCGACILKSDPLGCGWCRDSCLRKEECNTTWNNNSCPPFIHEVTPISGPTEGGTKLTVTGENFGWSNKSAPTVRVGRTRCENVTWNDTTIFCSLPPTEFGPHTAKVTVNCTTKQNSVHGYQIAGMSEIGEFNFTFKVPVVSNMTPLFGPRHGNTLLTIKGDNLDIGSDTFLSMCHIIRKNATSIVCKTHECQDIHTGNIALKDSKSCPFCAKNTLSIDNFKDMNKSFCYRPNPIINDISRNSTTISGGLVFKVTGKHFDSVQSYVFRTVLTPTISTDTICTQSNGTEIICLTPDFSNVSTVIDSVRGILLLGNDDYFWNIRTRNRFFHLKVFKDPSFETVDRALLTDVLLNSHHLELKGTNLQGLQPEDIRITIEGMDCPVVYVGSSMLRCDLSATIEKSRLLQEELSFDLKISVGNMNMHLGQMAFSHQQKLNLAGNKTLIPTALTCVLLILLVMCIICMRRYRVGPFKRKIIHHEQQVVYLADNSGQQVSHRLMPETDPESSTSTKLNDYVRDFDGNLLDHVPYGTANSVFADTVLVLEKQNLLIDGDCLRFDNDCSNLGRGNFGCVYKAFLKRPGQGYEMIVAVKTIIRSSDADVNAFLNEALIMKDFNHPNVLTLIGITLDKGEFPMVILPFMQNGSLLSYIRNENNMPTVKHLVTYGLHIALGMEYMAENKFVHRDLAARNCMLDVNFTVKVADFGLTRDVYSKEYYSSENKQRLPVKWMAPESLEHGKYSAKSDVWSFGVLLWELITRGAIPYSVVDNWDVGAYIKSGRRLPRPEYCQPYLYRLMRFCWQENPDKRPTFTHLRMEIQRMLNIKDSGKIAGDTHVELDRCTNYHYMDEMSLARQRSLSSTKWSVSSEDAALL